MNSLEHIYRPATPRHLNGGRNLFGLRRLQLAIWGLMALAAALPMAQAAAAKASTPPDRCLIIVETSKAMQPRAEGVLSAVQDIVTSGLNGHLSEGGTIGIWAFNEGLATGEFPLQVWASAHRKEIAQRAWAFVKGQKYSKQAEFGQVAAALDYVIKDSELLTVVLISSGEYEVSGTPYDKAINQFFRQWRGQQEKARLPFVTIMRAQKGQISSFVVNTPPWPLQVPYLATETNRPDAVHDKLVLALRNAQTSSVPPLMVTGKKPPAKPETNAGPATANTVAETTAAPAAVVATNQTPAEPPQPAPAPAVTETPAPQPVAQPSSVPTPAPEKKLEATQPPEPKPKETIVASATPVAPAPVVKPVPAPVSAAAPSPVAAPEAKPAPAAVTKAEAQPSPQHTSNAVASDPPPSAPETKPAAPVANPQTPGQAAAPTTTAGLISMQNIWLATTVLAVGAIIVALVALRRRRRVPLGSLITEAIEREKGP